MDDEFALCWNNFQDNIASGFQNLFDRGDLVDVTLACDGKLLQAHKIVLAICSPYFQEMFITNPCRHPIIVLKDVTYTVMTELLQFMYQGVVNVKHTELNSFMKIAQALQIKGLATSSSQQQSHYHHSHHHAQKSPSSPASASNVSKNSTYNATDNYPLSIDSKIFHSSPLFAQKRSADFINNESSYARKNLKRSQIESADNDISTETIENISTDDVFPIPQISMAESSPASRFDLSSVKRESNDAMNSPGSLRNTQPPSYGFDYNSAYTNRFQFGKDLVANNFLSKESTGSGSSVSIGGGSGNHMDIPPGSNITMLSSTSLLHGNCIYNRNNTVATQQGMKTYWLCKSYRITMCRARCITHQGRVISATGVHNHQPHMKGAYPNSEFVAQTANNVSGGSNHMVTMRLPSVVPTQATITSHILPTQTTILPTSSLANINQISSGNVPHAIDATLHMHSPITQSHAEHHSATTSPTTSVGNMTNMMPNILASNSLMHMTNISTSILGGQIHATTQSQSMPQQHTNANMQISPSIINSENNGTSSSHSPNSPHQNVSSHSHQHHLGQHSSQSESVNMQSHHVQQGQQVMTSTTTENANVESAMSVTTSPISSSPSMQPQQQQQQQQATGDTIHSHRQHNSMTSDPNIHSLQMNSHSSFKMEQI